MVATDTIVNRRGFEPLVKPNAHCQSIEAAMPGPVHVVSSPVKHKAIVVCRSVLTRQYGAGSTE